MQVIRSIKQETSITKPLTPLNKNRLEKLEKQKNGESDIIKNITAKNKNELSVEGLNKLERITDLADALMDLGNYGVYEETRREILHKLNFNKSI